MMAFMSRSINRRKRKLWMGLQAHLFHLTERRPYFHGEPNQKRASCETSGGYLFFRRVRFGKGDIHAMTKAKLRSCQQSYCYHKS